MHALLDMVKRQRILSGLSVTFRLVGEDRTTTSYPKDQASKDALIAKINRLPQYALA